MRVEARLFATLRDVLPPATRASGVTALELPEGATVADLARALGIPPGTSWIALVNGTEATPQHRLQAGDVVTLFPPLAGGAD